MTDRTDPKLVHLDGLNLTRTPMSEWMGLRRAWMLKGLRRRRLYSPAIPARRLKPLGTKILLQDRRDRLRNSGLSRAWCMQGIAQALPPNSRSARLLLASAQAHLQATLPVIASGHYEGEHWLATFAVYASFSHRQ